MKKEILGKLIKDLNGLRWFFISGFAVEIYSDGKRVTGDWDIVIKEDDAKKFAEKIGCKVEHRLIQKKNFVVDDYGFEGNYYGQDIEVTTGFPKCRILNCAFDKLFNRRVKVIYMGVEIFVEPMEELIVHKAFMHRPKDIDDLKLLKDKKINLYFLKELANDYGAAEKIINILKEIGYEI